jgi:hypothetical protein
MIRAHEMAVAKERQRKLKLLKRYYKIPEVAADPLPGFAVINTLVEFPVDWKGGAGGDPFAGPVCIPGAPKSGRRAKERSTRELERLLDCVNEIKRNNGYRTDREALRIIARRKEWSAPVNHRGKNWIDTLEQRLQAAKRFQRLLAKAEREFRDFIRQTNERSAT